MTDKNKLNLDLDAEYDDWYWQMVEREEQERMDEEANQILNGESSENKCETCPKLQTCDDDIC